MNTKENTEPAPRSRGRPRGFDMETALDTGQRLFHAGSYETVGLAALTDALGVKPPSFYKAFGSKSEFFAQVIERYAQSALALDEILLPGRAPADALAELLESAARTYVRDPEQRGCLVLEAARGNDGDASVIHARRVANQRRYRLREFIARTHPERASAVTDFVASTMSGLSASAREGMDESRLLGVARTAVAGLKARLDAD